MKRLIILAIPVILIMLAFSPAKIITVNGVITDQNGNPVSGVSV